MNWNLFEQKLHWRPLDSWNKRHESLFYTYRCGRGHLKCDCTRSEARFCLWAKRTNPFKSAGASVQSTAGSRGVRISGSNAGYTMFRGSVKGTGYLLHSPVSPSTSPPVRHSVPSHLNWSLQHRFPRLLWEWNWIAVVRHHPMHPNRLLYFFMNLRG